MELWRKKVQERCEKCAGTIRKSEKKTQNLPHCGSASGNKWQAVRIIFGDFGKERDVTEGNAGERNTRGQMLIHLPLYNERILNTAAPGGHTYGCR